MTWLKLDDKLRSHPKWLAQDIYGRALWIEAAMWCAEHNTDGVVPTHAIRLIGYAALVPPERLDATIGALVTGKLWKARPKARGAGWEFHDWLDYQPAKEQVQRQAETKSKHDWLHKTRAGKSVKERVRRRDGIWCRYCGIETRNDGDRRSPSRLTFDFVDPEYRFDRSAGASKESLDAATANIVVACGYCNAVKNNRTPDEAEMVMRDAPATMRGDLTQSTHDPIAGRPRPDRDPGSGHTGTGQIGTPTAPSTPVPSPSLVAGATW